MYITLLDFDALYLRSDVAFIDKPTELPKIAVSAFSFMVSQCENESDLNAASRFMRGNYKCPANILAVLTHRFDDRGHGILVGTSSVARERGRATNYVYGSAKAEFAAFLSGIRNCLAKKGVHVVTVLPGFIAT